MVPDHWSFGGSSPCLFHDGYRDQYRGPFYVSFDGTSDTFDDVGCRILAEP